MIHYAMVKKVNDARLILAVRLHTFKVSINFLRVQDTLGINSGRAFDVQHGVFWDFRAGVTSDKVIDSLLSIQQEFDLGDIWIFRSGDWDSYRAMCPTVLPYETSRDCVIQTPLIDVWFIDYMIRVGYKTIRILPKSMTKEPINFVTRLIGKPKLNLIQCKQISFILKHMANEPRINPYRSYDNCRLSQARYVVYETSWLKK